MDFIVHAAYLQYMTRDNQSDTEWVHPSLLQVLANICNIELRIWRLGAQNEVIRDSVPGHSLVNNYTNLSPLRERVDLLSIDSRFECLEFIGYEHGMPIGPIYPLGVSQNEMPLAEEALGNQLKI